MAELLARSRDLTSYADSPWYDRLFIQASSVVVEATLGETFVLIDGDKQPVRINERFEPNVPAPSIKELRAMRPKILGPTVSDCFQISARKSQGILVSAGALLSIISTSGKEHLVTLTRTADAEICPGEIQGPSGRCNRPIGISCFVELAEEILIVAERKGELFLIGFRGSPYLSDGETTQLIQRARDRALQQLDKELAKPSDSFTSDELQKLLGYRQLLEGASIILFVDSKPMPCCQEKRHTVLRNEAEGAELIEGMFSHYDSQANTLEARKVLALDLREYPDLTLIALLDGEGFGRAVELRDPEAPWPVNKLTPTLKRYLDYREFLGPK